MIIFFTCSDLLNCLIIVLHRSDKNEKWLKQHKVISTKKIFTPSSNFRCFNVFPVQPPQNFQVQAKISTILPVFPDYLSVSYDYGIFNFHNPKGVTSLTRLRLELSHLHKHEVKFRFQDPLWSRHQLWKNIERSPYFRLHCPNCLNERSTFLNIISRIV